MKRALFPFVLILGVLGVSYLSACGPGQLFGPTLTPSLTFTFTLTTTPTFTFTSTLTPTFTPVPPIPGVLYAAPKSTGQGNCLSWENACELQKALAQAKEGNEIWVKSGVYKPSQNDVSVAFVLKKGVALYGGFSGNEFSREQRDWEKHLTVLSCDMDGNDLNQDGNFVNESYSDIVGTNCWNVVSSKEVDTSAVLDGFIITGAVNGGIYNLRSSPTLLNLIVTGNSSFYDGGGITNYASSPVLKNVTFRGNKALSGGGMANIDGSNPVLIDAIFVQNVAEYNGGGLEHRYSTNFVAKNVTFIGNRANQGGGLSISGANNIRLLDVRFSDNSANVYGGGMASQGCKNVVFENVVFKGNLADHGAALANFDSDSVLQNVVFDSNRANLNGGAIFNVKANLVIVNGKFLSNQVLQSDSYIGGSNGGAIWNHDRSKIEIYQSIFWKNTVYGQGSAIYSSIESQFGQLLIVNTSFAGHNGIVFSNGFSSARLLNVIMWDSDSSVEISNLGTGATYVAHSNIRGCRSGARWKSSCGTDGGYNISKDPLFVNPESGDLRLQKISPCVDAGRNDLLPKSIRTDLDGQPRFVDIPDVTDTGFGKGPILDMGAYEVQDALLRR